MNNEVQSKLEKVSELCLQAQSVLREVLPELESQINKAEINRIMTELAFACEITFIIGLDAASNPMDK